MTDPTTTPTEPRCPARYERPGGAQPGDRIVECGLPAWHLVDHMETDTGVTWPRVHRDRTQPAQPAPAVPLSLPSPDAGSGRSRDPGGRNEPSDDIVETAAWALIRCEKVAWNGMPDGVRDLYRSEARAVLADVTPLIAAQERAKVADAHCPVCLHPWDTYHTWDGCRYVINRTADPSSPGVVCYCAEPRAARAVQLARRAARPVTGEGDRG